MEWKRIYRNFGLKVPMRTIIGEARKKPGGDYRGCRHEQPAEEDGYNAAKELLNNLGMSYADDDSGNTKINWDT